MRKLIPMFLLVVMSCSGQATSQRSAAEYYEVGHDLYWRGCVSDGYEEELCKEAIEKLEKAIEIDAKLADAYLLLETGYWNTGLKDKAVAILKKLVEVEPQNADAYYHLRRFTEDKNEQKALLEKAIELNPGHPEAHGALGLLLLRQGNVDEAIREYRTHLEVSPLRNIQFDARQHMRFARLLDVGRLKEAVEVYDKAVELTRGFRRVERCFLFKLIDLKPFGAFEEFVAKMQQLNRYCTKLGHRNRAVRLEQEGKIEEAIREWELQLEENPYYEGTYTALPDLYRSQGQTDKAREVVKKYFEIDTDPLYRCQQYKAMSNKGYERFAPEITGQVKKECEERMDANR